ncbi:MAG: hypothetical protein OXG97_10750 [Candidatus Poribacteria bacterium]|nr:hypothetical protein [Candidatus Poribacteria bacterium]
MKRTPILSILSLMLLCANICSVFAKAPTTPKILFTSTRDGNREIYTMNPDGSEQINLTQHPADDLHASWSPIGEQILFASDRDGVRDLYLMNTDGTNVRRVFKKESYRENPTWSPEGKHIAYGVADFETIKFTVRIATLGKQESEELVMDASDPAWSPDGTEIACSVGGRIVFINIRTRAQKRLLPRKTMNWQREPSWSAVGDKLAFAWNNNPLPPDHMPGKPVPKVWVDKLTIYLANHDGTGIQQLVDEAGPDAGTPKLSPNGTEILYTQEIKGSLQIFKLNISSGVRTQLTHIGGIFQANSGGDWFDPAYALPVSPQPQLLTTTWGEVKKKND